MQVSVVSASQSQLDDWVVASNSPMSVNQAFLLATHGGARALRRPDLGVLKVGAKADIVVFDGDASNLLGWMDPVAAVILHSHPGNVQHVLVDGVFRKKDFQLVVPRAASRDLGDAQSRFLDTAKRIQGQFQADVDFALEGDHKAGVPYVALEPVKVLPGSQSGY